jgi:hypothetical protein
MFPSLSNPTDWLEQMTVSKWQPINSPSLRGEFTLELKNGLLLHACRYFGNKTDRWVRAPQRKNEITGELENVVEFESLALHKVFLREALKAVDRYLQELRREY